MAGKTVPELTLLTAPAADSDEVVVYRSPGPLKKLTAATFADYLVKTALGFIQTGTGAVARTVQARLRDTVHVTDFGEVGVGGDDSAVFQLAINTGKTVLIPAGGYLCNNLTQSTNSQQIIGLGRVNILKNANGPIISASGDDVVISNVAFYGDATTPVYTGDNIVLTGARPTLLNCGSQWAHGLAVKATGNRVRILGCISTYQSANASASAMDIEIGTSGTATLYHQIGNITNGQATGGIRFIDTGNHFLHSSQIGNLIIQAGTSPAGVNGGHTFGNRIVSNVTVEMSNAVFSANLLGGNLTFASGTSLCSFDASNGFAGSSVVTNNGNANNNIVRNISTGSVTELRYGPDSSLARLQFSPTSGNMEIAGDYRAVKGKGIQFQSVNDTYGNRQLLVSDVNANMFLTNNDGSIIYSTVGSHQFFVDAVQRFELNAAGDPNFGGATQTTVGAAGGANALPATPTGYLSIQVGGVDAVIPYYAKS